MHSPDPARDSGLRYFQRTAAEKKKVLFLTRVAGERFVDESEEDFIVGVVGEKVHVFVLGWGVIVLYLFLL